MYGVLCTGGLGTDCTFEVLGWPESTDRFAVVVVVVVAIGHVDTAVESVEHTMSNYLYFLLFCDLLLLFLPNLFSLTGVKGLKFLFSCLSFLSSLYLSIFFLKKKRASLACSRGYMKSPELFSPSSRYECHPPSALSSPQ